MENLIRRGSLKLFLAAAVVFGALVAGLVPPAIAQSTSQQEASGVVTGRVIVGGKGVAGIPVILVSNDPSPVMKPVGRAVTDETGKFRITEVAAGQYSATAVAPGYAGSATINLTRSGRPVTVAEGETVDGVDLQLAKGAVITGKVTEASGRPIVGEPVSLLVEDGQGTRRVTVNTSMFLETDDRGIYRVFGLPAGRYTVSVGQSAGGGPIRIGAGAYYRRTFHPDAVDETKATVIELSEGTEATGIDIVVGARNRTFRATGRMINSETGKPVANARYGWGTQTTPQMQMLPMSIGSERTDAAGRFTVEGLTPGRYFVFAALDQGDSYSDAPSFEISDSDVSNLEIRLMDGGSISGTAVVEGSSDPSVLAKLKEFQLGFSMETAPGTPNVPRMSATRIEADGTFRIGGIRPGKVRLRASLFPRSKDLFLTRIEQGGVPQPGAIEVGPGDHVTGIRLVFSSGAGSIRGKVTFEGGELPPDAVLFVMARPMDRPGDILRAPIDARGRFIIDGVPPGEWELNITPAPQPGSSPTRPILVNPVRQTTNVNVGAPTDVSMTVTLGGTRREQRQ